MSIQHPDYAIDHNERAGFVRWENTTSRDALTGWKFHLSINPEDLNEARDIILPIVTANNIRTVKMALYDTAREFDKRTNPQSGKQFTLYASENVDMPKLLQDLEIALRKEGIRPSQDIKGDRRIPGSQYIAYRNDKTSEAIESHRDPKDILEEAPTYLGADEVSKLVKRHVIPQEMRYNPGRHPDKFQQIDFTKDAEIQMAAPEESEQTSMKSPHGRFTTLVMKFTPGIISR